MQGLQFLDNLPLGGGFDKAFGHLDRPPPNVAAPFANSSPFTDSARNLRDILAISPDSLDVYNENKSVLQDMEKGIEELREQDARLAQLRLEFLRREMALIKDMLANAGQPEQKSSLFKHLQGIGKRLQNVGAHVEQASGNAQRSNPASSRSPLSESQFRGRLAAYEESLSVDIKQTELKLSVERLELSDNEIRRSVQEIDLTLTQVNITLERTEFFALDSSRELVDDFARTIKAFEKLAKDTAKELLGEKEAPDEDLTQPLDINALLEEIKEVFAEQSQGNVIA